MELMFSNNLAISFEVLGFWTKICPKLHKAKLTRKAEHTLLSEDFESLYNIKSVKYKYTKKLKKCKNDKKFIISPHTKESHSDDGGVTLLVML